MIQKSDVHRLYISGKFGGRSLIATGDCVELVVRDLEIYVYGGEERLKEAARGDKLDALERSSKCFEENKKREEVAILGGESFTWSVFETN